MLVQVALDGASIATLTTDENGNFSLFIPVSMSGTRRSPRHSSFTWAIPLGWAVKTK